MNIEIKLNARNCYICCLMSQVKCRLGLSATCSLESPFNRIFFIPGLEIENRDLYLRTSAPQFMLVFINHTCFYLFGDYLIHYFNFKFEVWKNRLTWKSCYNLIFKWNSCQNMISTSNSFFFLGTPIKLDQNTYLTTSRSIIN